jgi:hypothetical protein
VEYDSIGSVVTIGLRRKDYGEIAKFVEQTIRNQLFDDGNGSFYKAVSGLSGSSDEDFVELGAGGIPPRSGSEYSSSRQPDGALSVPLISWKPIIVIEAANSETHRKAHERCMHWMTYHKGLINFVVLVKLKPWSKRKCAKEGKDCRRTASVPSAAGMDPTIVYDDEEDLVNDEAGRLRSSLTHIYRRASISVYGTEVKDQKRRMRNTEIEDMEVWPARPSKPWRFTVCDIFEDDTPEDLKKITVEISFQFLHTYIDQNMAIKHVVPIRRGDPDTIEAWPHCETTAATESECTATMLHEQHPKYVTDNEEQTPIKTTTTSEAANAENGGLTAGMGVGYFYTRELHPWYEPHTYNTVEKLISPSYTAPPRVAIGLNMLDLDHRHNIRVRASATEIRNDHLTLSLSSWQDSIMYSAGCSWLELGEGTADLIQTGVFSTTDVRPWSDVQVITEKRITFDKAFPDNRPPNVVVWFSSLDMDSEHNWRASANASHITARGFTINAKSWADTKLYSAWVTWVAYPSDSTEICSGHFSTMDSRPWTEPRHKTTGQVAFGSNVTFEKTPQLVVALCSLDYDQERNLRWKSSTSAVTTSGFTWDLESWGDSKMFSSSAMYIAFAAK